MRQQADDRPLCDVQFLSTAVCGREGTIGANWRRIVVSGSEPPLTCWICGIAVSLESCAIDEHGMAVHEDCSVRKMASKANASTPQHKLPPKPQRNPPDPGNS